jgi:ppGpp synthetase/RelA/SpoT-type nucleotidyltranferase
MKKELLEEFLDHYSREIDYYSEAARICSERCKSLLNASGIRAIVTYRAKSLERLREKISKRSSETSYQNARDIYEDIPDFAGVRIAVYFPQDRDRVGQLINENLEVFKTKKFPDEQSPRGSKMIFKGYVAEHYRARMKEQDLAPDQKRYARTGIEVQVASVLMHAWSEVEHDLVYKPLSETLSIREEETLDQLNGLVLSGEIASNNSKMRSNNEIRGRVNRLATTLS